jgi:site-specific recombinase XerD
MLPIVPHDLDHLYAERSILERGLFARNTEKSYAQSWKRFSLWCQQAQRNSLPATTDTVSLYLTDLLDHGRKVSTAVNHTSGITHRHRINGYPTPVDQTIWSLLAGAQRLRLERPRQMEPLDVRQIRRISGILRSEGTREAFRDRGIIVLGFTSALRRATITELQLSDIEFTRQGVVIHVRHEKQDQRGKGRWIAVAAGKHPDTCLESCLRDWLRYRGSVEDGPLFTSVRHNRLRPLSPAAVGRIVKDAVQRISLDPSKFSGHSLRAGFCTAAAEAGVNPLLIAAHTGHTRLDTLKKYFRRRDLFRGNCSGRIGL